MLALDTLPVERILEQGTPLMASGGQARCTCLMKTAYSHIMQVLS